MGTKFGLLLSEKEYMFSDRIKPVTCMQPIDTKVKSRIFGSGRGTLFTPTDFVDLGTRDAVDKTLSRLAASGTLRRLARGLYDYPQMHPVLGALLPTPEVVARALAQRDAVRLQPAGAYAANLLGLSDQVPAKIVFLTNGPSRRVKVGSMEITLRRTTPRNVATAGRLSGMLIHAFRHLGRTNITPSRIKYLQRTIPQAKRKELLRDLRYAPAWMHPVFRQLAEEES